MPVKSKADLAALANVPEADRADISALFDAIAAKDDEIGALKKKNDDADKVVKRMPELERQLAEREQLTAELKAKLDRYTVNPTPVEDFDDMGPFAEVRKFFAGLFDDEPETPAGGN